jgi:hypothetical protein
VPACRTSAASRSLRARAKLAEPSSGLRLVLAFILPIGGWPGAIGDAESQYGTGRPGSQKEAVVLAWNEPPLSLRWRLVMLVAGATGLCSTHMSSASRTTTFIRCCSPGGLAAALAFLPESG